MTTNLVDIRNVLLINLCVYNLLLIYFDNQGEILLSKKTQYKNHRVQNLREEHPKQEQEIRLPKQSPCSNSKKMKRIEESQISQREDKY